MDYAPNENGIYSTGELDFDYADDANIPVDIWLERLTEDDDSNLFEAGYRYRLRASNYMPRKGRIAEAAYECYAAELAPLQQIIKEKILRIYGTAIETLTYLAYSGKTGNLYYWSTCNEDSE